VNPQKNGRDDGLVHLWGLGQVFKTASDLDNLLKDEVKHVVVESFTVDEVPEIGAVAHCCKLVGENLLRTLLHGLDHSAESVDPWGCLGPLCPDPVLHPHPHALNTAERHDDIVRAEDRDHVADEIVAFLGIGQASLTVPALCPTGENEPPCTTLDLQRANIGRAREAPYAGDTAETLATVTLAPFEPVAEIVNETRFDFGCQRVELEVVCRAVDLERSQEVKGSVGEV